MYDQIQIILTHADYTDDDPTETNLINCFLDYVDGGAFSNLDYDEAADGIRSGEISLKQIIKAMNRILKSNKKFI